jgi:phytoene dehydrogenase-like protein
VAEKRYDVIIIGAGPNGLSLGAYLSKAGLKVLVLERRHEAGGGLATEAVTLGDFIHNTHAMYKVKHIYPSLQFALPLSDGRCVCLYSDVEKTCNSIARFSQRDADSYRELYHICKRCMDEFIAPATYVPPVPALDQLVTLQKFDVGREILEYSEKTPKEIVDHFFENEHVKALMLYIATQWGIAYDQPSLGYLVLLLLNRAANTYLVAGGSHMVAQALNKVIHEQGQAVRNNVRIKRIIMEEGAARGVELEDGSLLYADEAVVSTIDPHHTFLELVGEENLEKEFAEKIKGWQWEKDTLLQTQLALEEAPNFTAAASDPEINKAFIYVLGYEIAEELINDFEAIDKGELPDTARFNCSFPTVHDPSQAPPGRHTGILSRFAPYRLRGDAQRWYNYKLKQELVEQGRATLERYAPNMTKEKVLWSYVTTPMDIENKFPNMVEGSYKQGLYHPLQMGYLRPNEECSESRTPIKNLYLGGASCYPGGLVVWGAGYAAANAIAEDFGIQKWWTEPEMIARARERGLL